MPRASTFWLPARDQRLCDLIAAERTFEQVAEDLGTTRNAVAGRIFALRKRGDPRIPAILPRRPWGRKPSDRPARRLTRHPAPKPSGSGRVLGESHPAAVEGRTLFPGTVAPAVAVKNILKDGVHQAKLGVEVSKGIWKGMPLFALTLEERATCPRSCAMWFACYGNGMPRAQRVDHRSPVFALRLEAELIRLAAYHPGGFVVRLHILGDFYSVGYVALWRRFLAEIPALRVFGYTANPIVSPIGQAIIALNTEFADRFMVRFSGRAGGEGARRGTEVVERAELASPGSVVCPAATGRTECCGTCGLICVTSPKTIAFPRH